MALIDCFGRIVSLDAADKASIQASVASKVSQGMAQADAEKAAVQEHSDRVMAQAEDMRKQLNAPAPFDITLDKNTAALNQPGPIRIAGQDEVGRTYAEHAEYLGRLYREDKELEKAGNGLENLDGAVFKRQNGNPIVFRAASMDDPRHPILTEGGPGEPFYVSAKTVVATENNLVPGTKEMVLTEGAAAQLTEEFGDPRFIEGMSLQSAMKKLHERLTTDESARKLISAMAVDNFDLETLAWRGPDGAIRVTTMPDLLIDPATKQSAMEFLQSGPPVRELSAEAQKWLGTRTAEEQALLADDVAARRANEADSEGDLGNLQQALIAAQSPKRKAKTSKSAVATAPRASIAIIDDMVYVNVFPGADLSSLSHEMSHFFLHEFRRLVQTGLASDPTVERYQTLMKWLGNEGEQLTETQHEKFAAHWELYLLNGEAPTKALEDSFGLSRKWLTRIYSRVVANDPQAGLEAVTGQKLALLPEIREVFDRLLSLEPEVENATTEAEFQTLASELEQKIPEELRREARIKIDDLLEDAKLRMEDRLFEHRAKAIAAQKPGWRKTAEELVKNYQVYKAVEFLKKAPLDRTQIQSEYGDAAFKSLSTKHGSLVTAETDVLGLDPEIAAAETGYESGKALIDALRTAPTQEGAVRAAVKAEADAEWESYGPEDAMAETPEFAASMDAARKYLLEALNKPGKVDKKAVRRQAETAMATLSIKQATDVRGFLQNMAREQRGERESVIRGDLEQALKHNIAGRMNFEQAQLARKIKDHVRAVVKFAKSTRDLDPAVVEYQHALNAKAIAQRYGMLPVTEMNDRISLRAVLEARKNPDSPSYTPTLDAEVAFPDWILNEERAGDFRDLTLDDLTDVDYVMRNMVTTGRNMLSQKVLNGKKEKDRIVAECVKPMGKLKDKNVPEYGSLWAKVVCVADSVLAGVNILQFRVKAQDGHTDTNEVGPNEQYIYDPLNRASSELQVLNTDFNKMAAPALKHISERVRSGPRYVEGLEPTSAMKAKGVKGFTLESEFVVALNMGNSYNAEAMAIGLGYVNEHGDPQTHELEKHVKDLTKADWAAVQILADAVHSLKAPHYAAFQERNGYPLAEVEPEAFSVRTADGETVNLPGWYYPVKFDPILSEVKKRTDKVDELQRSFSMFPLVGTRKGMQKRRSSTGGKPLLLSLSGLQSHVTDVTQYIAFGQIVLDVHRIIQDPVYKTMMIDKFGVKAHDAIRSLLADLGMPNQEMLNDVDRLLSWSKGAASTWALGWNVASALKQPFSLGGFAVEEGPLTVARGLKAVLTLGPTAAREKVLALSPTMAAQWVAADREVADAIQSVNWLSNPKLKALRNSAFAFTNIGDHVGRIPAWLGAFEKRLETMPEKEAAEGADKAVLLSYPGNPRALDASSWLRSKKGIMRLWTSFATQAFHYGNRQRFYVSGVLAGNISPTRFAGHVATEWIATPLAMTAFFQILWGNWPPKDKDDAKKYASEIGSYLLSGIPFARELSNVVLHPEKGIGGNIAALRGFDMVGKLGSTVLHLAEDLEDEKDPKFKVAVMALCDLVSFAYKVPLMQVYHRTMKGIDQLHQYPNDDAKLEWLNDLFTLIAPDPGKKVK